MSRFESSGEPVHPSVEVLGHVHERVILDGFEWRFDEENGLQTIAGDILVEDIYAHEFGRAVCGQVFREYSRHLHALVQDTADPTPLIRGRVHTIPDHEDTQARLDVIYGDTPSHPAIMGGMLLTTMVQATIDNPMLEFNLQNWLPIATDAIHHLAVELTVLGGEQ